MKNHIKYLHSCIKFCYLDGKSRSLVLCFLQSKMEEDTNTTLRLDHLLFKFSQLVIFLRKICIRFSIKLVLSQLHVTMMTLCTFENITITVTQ